ncbi:hypothetical protein SFA35_03430 [Pseudomonas sp. HR96]|uniref:hypothetical protein n=1 Tax=Pseudomonas sp. HR96 TaxID=1027966 RepID=UPI002A75195E|nr:hypothetical protein [Pseudomonas sp. HR96]WPP00451.1 hypothetical protein SFA35_03430 [Pseudomonas sp. HR96]
MKDFIETPPTTGHLQPVHSPYRARCQCTEKIELTFSVQKHPSQAPDLPGFFMNIIFIDCYH